MKLIALFLLPLSIFSQTITLEDLAYGHTHKVFETQDYLLKKGLSFIGKKAAPLPDASFYGFSANDIQYVLLVGDANGVIIRVELYMDSPDNYIFLGNYIQFYTFS